MPPIIVYNLQRLFRPGGSAIARALDATEEQDWDTDTWQRKVTAVGPILAPATEGGLPAIVVLSRSKMQASLVMSALPPGGLR